MQVKNKGRCALMIGRTIIPSGQIKTIDTNLFKVFKESKAGRWYLEHQLEVIETPVVQLKEINKKKSANKKSDENPIKQGVTE